MHEASTFVTLTYDDEHCPTSLRYADFQRFMQRLRRRVPKARFFMCGEYGETTFRPHFHALLFGVFFDDREVFSTSGDLPLYTSKRLASLWPQGFSTLGDVTFESAAYCARYVMKKVTGPKAEEHYLRADIRTGEMIQLKPEFCRMSLKPGIGMRWLETYFKDVYGESKDGVIMNGHASKPPRYYDKQLQVLWPEMVDDIEYRRYLRSGNCAEDGTRERLSVREQVTAARVGMYRRSL